MSWRDDRYLRISMAPGSRDVFGRPYSSPATSNMGKAVYGILWCIAYVLDDDNVLTLVAWRKKDTASRSVFV